MRLSEVVTALKRFKFLAASVVVIFIVLGAFAAYLPGPKYKATAILVATPAGANADFNSVTNVQFVLPALVQQVGTETFRAKVFRGLGSGRIDPAAVSVSAALDQGTGIIRVSANSPNAQSVVAVSNEAAKQLIASKLFPTVKLTLLQPALGVTNTSAGLRIPIIFVSAVLGFIAAIFAALAANSLRSGKLTEAFVASLGVEILGEIPKRRLPRSGMIDVIAVPTRLGSIDVSEAFHKLVANLRAARLLDDSPHVAVMSCASGEGKTTVAAGLACGLALSGSDVVAIDADLRQGRLHEEFGLSASSSWTDTPREELAQRTRLSRLKVIPASASDQHPAKTIASSLPELVKSEKNAIVIVDSPPVLAVAEATLIAHIVSKVILVVEPGHTSRDAFTRILHDLQRANVNVLGVVLNRVDGLASGNIYGGYPAITPDSLLNRTYPSAVPKESETPRSVEGSAEASVRPLRDEVSRRAAD